MILVDPGANQRRAPNYHFARLGKTRVIGLECAPFRGARRYLQAMGVIINKLEVWLNATYQNQGKRAF